MWDQRQACRMLAGLSLKMPPEALVDRPKSACRGPVPTTIGVVRSSSRVWMIEESRGDVKKCVPYSIQPANQASSDAGASMTIRLGSTREKRRCHIDPESRNRVSFRRAFHSCLPSASRTSIKRLVTSSLSLSTNAKKLSCDWSEVDQTGPRQDYSLRFVPV